MGRSAIFSDEQVVAAATASRTSSPTGPRPWSPISTRSTWIYLRGVATSCPPTLRNQSRYRAGAHDVRPRRLFPAPRCAGSSTATRPRHRGRLTPSAPQPSPYCAPREGTNDVSDDTLHPVSPFAYHLVHVCAARDHDLRPCRPRLAGVQRRRAVARLDAVGDPRLDRRGRPDTQRRHDGCASSSRGCPSWSGWFAS